ELGEQVGPNVYQLDLDFYNLEENPTVTSPYTGEPLNVYYSGGEEYVIDYRPDLNHIIENEGLELKTGEDIRKILYEYTPIVPIYSQEMTVDEHNETIHMTSLHKNYFQGFFYSKNRLNALQSLVSYGKVKTL